MEKTNTNLLGYAGDLTPDQAWQMLADQPNAVIIDVRTPEEWSFVGVPNLEDINRDIHFIPWAFFPRMTANPDFVDQVQNEATPEPKTPILFLCRSGVRSVHAARALTQAGFNACYNILNGFEGDPDEFQQRGKTSGWKVSNLPWHQK